MFNLILAETAATAETGGRNWTSLILIVVVFVVMYAVILIPQRKKDKKLKQMLADLKNGDVICTIGGIMGKIVNVQEDEITIETSIERTKMTMKKWAVRNVETVEEESSDAEPTGEIESK
ncbi:MAG TPA: preprotein translocase subunit YajC [Clostridia bacterium]|jgi:preprotein translocase subunit YajC|nr:MAG: preprotein translocase subunit YajC [Firmicutes bacterium ADurb.Bin099]HHT95997.1 preprotein translocase subunit YajC [Clostridiaceae bacterium]HNZ41211.1 preprotein translocase subunit YajC [Clostridia bacterium]HOF27150.1 preprotein translocase subunit YajC [Clostridia bacterium]HOM34842.1 preprotein translocase subunit YajC [Clostridia bacterium]